ncbi:MAG: TasA family protein [Dehalococcoidia bacterium]|nr:TasA family protein [Dehalococcoidia bacterium]
MKKIVGLSLALIMVVGMIGVETFAYFADSETSSGNQLAAGTLDLKTNNVDGVTQTLYATNMSPGATVGPYTIPLRNAGTTDGATLDIGFSYVESDGSPNTVNKTDDAVAALMEVITLDYGGSSLLSSISDINGNGYKDVYDLKNSSLTGLSGIAASATKNFVISVRLRSETGNDFQADGITMTMTFTLKQ